MENKVTVYKSLIKKFKDMGYKVSKGSWIESVGYDVPTKQYWFDVTIGEKKKVETTMHFYFGDDKNSKPEIEIWENHFEFYNLCDKKII